MKLRPAYMFDCADIWIWRNDPVTRANSRNKDEIPWLEHFEWYQKNHKRLWIGDIEGYPIGVVRCDSDGEVSINMSPSLRNKGHGKELLSLACEKWGERTLKAYILPDNVASQRIFEACGFKKGDEPCWYYKSA